MFKTVEQCNSLLDRFLFIPPSLTRITGNEIFIKVSPMGCPHQILQTFLVGGITVTETGTVDVNHIKIIVARLLCTEEVRQVQITMQDAFAMHQKSLFHHGISQLRTELFHLSQQQMAFRSLNLLTDEIAFQEQATAFLFQKGNTLGCVDSPTGKFSWVSV